MLDDTLVEEEEEEGVKEEMAGTCRGNLLRLESMISDINTAVFFSVLIPEGLGIGKGREGKGGGEGRL